VRAEPRAFWAAGALLFLASAWGTIAWCSSMSGGMAMPGGWTMSMAWMRMPGQSWILAAGSFLAMWLLMMVAMMLPSLLPMLSRFRRAVNDSSGGGLGSLTVIAGAGYFCVWAVFGAAAYVVGAALAAAAMRWPPVARTVPAATGVVLLLAGSLQLSGWKARQLAHCREAPACGPPVSPGPRGAFRHGLRLGLHCSFCCSGFIVALLVIGVMDLAAMAVVAAAITLERVAPRPVGAARATGVLLGATGALWIGRALGAV
jgi:predicted metal-binding membrane protein